jgi:hypothetical protein
MTYFWEKNNIVCNFGQLKKILTLVYLLKAKKGFRKRGTILGQI